MPGKCPACHMQQLQDNRALLARGFHCVARPQRWDSIELKGIAGFGGGIWLFTLFKGYDWVTVLVVANLAFSGLLVSWVMKFADSILKVRAHAPDFLTACSNLCCNLSGDQQLCLLCSQTPVSMGTTRALLEIQ